MKTTRRRWKGSLARYRARRRAICARTADTLWRKMTAEHRHGCFQVAIVVDGDIVQARMHGDPNMPAETREALDELMRSAYRQFAPQHQPKRLPTIEEIGGSDPDFTGGLESSEYVRRMRDVGGDE